jgi:hypothetical protein
LACGGASLDAPERGRSSEGQDHRQDQLQPLRETDRTVDTHRAYIMRKLQLETRAELVMFALANGVIGPDAG